MNWSQSEKAVNNLINLIRLLQRNTTKFHINIYSFRHFWDRSYQCHNKHIHFFCKSVICGVTMLSFFNQKALSDVSHRNVLHSTIFHTYIVQLAFHVAWSERNFNHFDYIFDQYFFIFFLQKGRIYQRHRDYVGSCEDGWEIHCYHLYGSDLLVPLLLSLEWSLEFFEDWNMSQKLFGYMLISGKYLSKTKCMLFSFLHCFVFVSIWFSLLFPSHRPILSEIHWDLLNDLSARS